eukprot:2418031-Pleurochrysis_carterae.AAC.1
MKPTLRCPSRRLRLRRAALRRALVASIARAGVAKGADVVALTKASPTGVALVRDGSTGGATASFRRRAKQSARHATSVEGAS